MQKITPFLWFNDQAEEAMSLYAQAFSDGEIVAVHRTAEGKVHSGTVRLQGQEFHCFNGGSHFTFSPAVSLMVACETQAEVDRLWAALTADGGQEQPCGWLTDKFGVSWQITPRALMRLLQDPDAGRRKRATEAMMTMQKIDIAALESAAG